MQKRNLCLFHKSGLNRVTDDNKGVKFYHPKPYCNSNSKWFHSPCCRQFERSNYFTSILFYHLQVNENFLKLVTEFLKNFTIYLYIFLFSITKRPCSFEQSLFLLDLKLSPHQQRCRCLLNFSLHVSCVLQVQRVQPYQVQHLTMQLILIVLHQC